MGWWNKAKTADSNFSLASWGWSAAQWMFPGAVGTIMAWAAAYRDWIWNTYGVLGVLSVGLIGAFVASAALALSGLGFKAFRAAKTKIPWPTEEADRPPDNPRFRSFAERYIIERCREWKEGEINERAWAAILEAKSIYDKVKQVSRTIGKDA